MNYTSIKQSQKLLELGLNPETSDMIYSMVNGRSTPFIRLEKINELDELHDVVCWSVGALLELLPKRLEIVDNVYELSVYLYGLYYWNITNGNLCFEAKDKDNLVDACVDMIIRLNELKIL